VNRLFTQAQKKHMYIASGGRCQKCGETLGIDWEAHHINRYTDGGVTEITNGLAVCHSCHKKLHRGKTMQIKARGWQVEALEKSRLSKEISFLLNATPGAGKTIYSALEAGRWLQDYILDFVIIVVPTTALKGDSHAGFLGDWTKAGIEIKTQLKEGRGVPKEFSGAVVTYQQLPNLITTFKTWRDLGIKLGFVFDEVHHASERNTWGAATSECHAMAEKVLAMTGTPFRGDGIRISFVRYDNEGRAIADHNYSYREAIRDGVCREVEFYTDDGIAEYIIDENQENVRVSEATQEQEGMVKSVIFHKDSHWLETTLAKADEKLDQYRTGYNAGGIVICRPGNDENDDRHLLQIAKKIRMVTGEEPVVITHDDKDANAKIEAFRKSNQKWIVSVRKISEGVDIKRLRVMVMASKPGTELLFRQLVGRVVRQESRSEPETATVYMAKFPQLQEWAAQIMEEAQAGLRDREEREREPVTDESKTDFIPLGATHEDGGAISIHGEQFTAPEIRYAEEIKINDPLLSTTSVTTIAHILKKDGKKIEPEEVHEPLQAKKVRIRQDINKLVRRLALRIQEHSGSDRPAFAQVWQQIHQAAGVRDLDDLMDNHPLEKANQVHELLKQLMGSWENAA